MIKRWLNSTNAKDIGVLYLIFSLISGIIGTTLSVIIRAQLAGYIKTDNELYNVVVTMHGLIMIFLCDCCAFIKRVLNSNTRNNPISCKSNNLPRSERKRGQ